VKVSDKHEHGHNYEDGHENENELHVHVHVYLRLYEDQLSPNHNLHFISKCLMSSAANVPEVWSTKVA
jgi:hypothetical protein